jgi:MipA family protein
MLLTRFAALTLVSSAFVHTGASAQSAPANNLPLWELGVVGFGVSQQAYPGSDQRVGRGLVLPYVVYRGQWLRADQNTAGLRALKTDRLELDLGVSGSFGSSSDDITARRGMPDLGTLIEFGPRLKVNLGEWADGKWRLDLPVRGVFDLEDGLRHKGNAFEPELVYSRRADGGWRYSTSVGALVADTKLANHFYGVAPRFANAARPAYNAKSGLVGWRVGVSANKNLTPDWQLFGFVRADSVSGAANRASPLVKQTTGFTAGIGVAYTWMRSSERGRD